jgi:hypothetical protein
MWYRNAIKYNIFGVPISSDPPINLYVGEDEESTIEEKPLEEDIEIDDPTPEDEFTPEDLQGNIQKIENDPTYGIKLPPLHSNCHCTIETLPILTSPGIKDGKRVWMKSERCCPVCEKSAIAFNEAEKMRLRNKGININ